jgi:hypothetical protein
MRIPLALVILLPLGFVACAGDVSTPTNTEPSALVSPTATASTGPAPSPTGIDYTGTPAPSVTTPAETPTEALTATPNGGSGVDGVALAGPQCPVERLGSPCPDKPVANATINVQTADRRTNVASAQTDSNGRFVVALSPGDYYLDPQSPDPSRPYPIGKPQTVTVQDGEWTQVTVSYDTGIR